MQHSMPNYGDHQPVLKHFQVRRIQHEPDENINNSLWRMTAYFCKHAPRQPQSPIAVRCKFRIGVMWPQSGHHQLLQVFYAIDHRYPRFIKAAWSQTEWLNSPNSIGGLSVTKRKNMQVPNATGKPYPSQHPNGDRLNLSTNPWTLTVTGYNMSFSTAQATSGSLYRTQYERVQSCASISLATYAHSHIAANVLGARESSSDVACGSVNGDDMNWIEVHYHLQFFPLMEEATGPMREFRSQLSSTSTIECRVNVGWHILSISDIRDIILAIDHNVLSTLYNPELRYTSPTKTAYASRYVYHYLGITWRYLLTCTSSSIYIKLKSNYGILQELCRYFFRSA